MEPMIPDGAVVTIDKQPDLENGQIGVFLINGDEGIVKKFYREDKFIRLVSINPAFKDIIILEEDKEEFIIVGKVIKVTYLL
jgi:repressor LexA